MANEEGESEFASGYESDETPAEKPEVKAPEVIEAVAPTVEAKPDPLAELQARFDKLEARTRNAEGHIGGLNHNQRLLQDTLAASKAATNKVDDAPTQAQVQEAMANPREWEDLKSDFPEWATATEKYMDARMAAKQSGADMESINRSVQEQIKGGTQALQKEIINASLEAVFPGWEDDIRTPEFSAWFGTQANEVKALADSSKVGDAARMLRLYETAKQATPAAREKSIRKQRIEAALNPKGTGGYSASPTDTDQFEAGYSGR